MKVKNWTKNTLKHRTWGQRRQNNSRGQSSPTNIHNAGHSVVFLHAARPCRVDDLRAAVSVASPGRTAESNEGSDREHTANKSSSTSCHYIRSAYREHSWRTSASLKQHAAGEPHFTRCGLSLCHNDILSTIWEMKLNASSNWSAKNRKKNQ